MDRGQAYQYVCELLKVMLAQKSSDLFITANYPPAMKIDGKMTKIGPQNLSAAHTLALVKSVMTDKQVEEFEATKESNFAIRPMASVASASMPLYNKAQQAWSCA